MDMKDWIKFRYKISLRSMKVEIEDASLREKHAPTITTCVQSPTKQDADTKNWGKF